MALLDLYVAGAKKGYAALSFAEELSFPTSFEADLDPTLSVNVGHDVEIKEDTGIVFKGVLEAKEQSEGDGFNLRVRGRDAGWLKLARFLTGVESYYTDPADIFQALITPTIEIAKKTVWDDDFLYDRGGWTLKRGGYLIADFCRLWDNQYNASDPHTWLRRSETTENGIVKVKVRPLSRYDGGTGSNVIFVGAMQRYSDGNYYAAYLGWYDSGAYKAFILGKWSGGSWTMLFSEPFEWEYGQDYDIVFEAWTAFLEAKVAVSGTEQWTTCSAVDEALASGSCGLLAGAAIAEFDDYSHHAYPHYANCSSMDPNHPPWLAADGYIESAWVSEAGTSHWWWMDMGQLYQNICRIGLWWGEAPGTVKIEVSQDDENWETVYDQETSGGIIDKVFTPRSVRYVKVTFTFSTSKSAIIQECYVYQTTEDGSLLPIGQLDIYGKVVTFEVNYEPRSEAVKRLAEEIGYQVWYTPGDGKINFGKRGGYIGEVAGTIIMKPSIADTWILHGDSNQGSDYAMDVRSYDPGGANHPGRSLVKFITPTIPEPYEVLTAKLKFRIGAYVLLDFDIAVHRITGDWNEMTVIWATQPSFNPTPTSVRTFPATSFPPPPYEVIWDGLDGLENDVKAWVNGEAPNYGWLIKCLSEDPPFKLVQFKTREQPLLERRPELIVQYGTPDGGASIEFKRGVNIHSIAREITSEDLAWKVLALGHGEGVQQLKVTVSDSSVKAAYPTLAREHVEVAKDIVDEVLLEAYAQLILSSRKVPKQYLMLLVDGEAYSRAVWAPGTTVKIQDAEIGVDAEYRVVRMTTHGFPCVVEFDAEPEAQLQRLEDRDLEGVLVDLRERVKWFEKIKQA